MSSKLDIDQWHYLHGKPTAGGKFKTQADDFYVQEILGYSPSGEGEHIYLWTRKTGLNTAFVAEQLATFCQLPLRNITYAGRKDKHAVSEQWFGVHLPGKGDFDWAKMQLEGFEVLHAARHNKKLRVGNLTGNRFKIRLRDLSDSADLRQRIEKIAQIGVPNYFGEQRFGVSRHHQAGGNLALAEKMLQGEAIKNRNKRSMAISALRSWLFNEFVSQRIASGFALQAMSGDTFILNGSNSFFSATDIDDTILKRLSEGDILLSAPLWGKGKLTTETDAHGFESNLAQRHSKVCQLLENLGLEQQRRHTILLPRNLQFTLDKDLLIEFDLPAGCFATAVLRELLILDQNAPENNQTEVSGENPIEQ